jgi:hypothetical protein
MKPSSPTDTNPKEVSDLADAATRIAQNKGRIKAKTQEFVRKIKLRQLSETNKMAR